MKGLPGATGKHTDRWAESLSHSRTIDSNPKHLTEYGKRAFSTLKLPHYYQTNHAHFLPKPETDLVFFSARICSIH